MSLVKLKNLLFRSSTFHHLHYEEKVKVKQPQEKLLEYLKMGKWKNLITKIIRNVLTIKLSRGDRLVD